MPEELFLQIWGIFTCKKQDRRQKAAINENGILQEDVLFRSPSYAAASVIGGHVNGLTAWVTDDGKTLKDIEGS